MKFTDKYPNQSVRALSWKQPFASLMLHGKAETRVWDTKYRGWVLICASKSPYSLNKLKEISGMTQLNRIMEYLPTGVLAQRTGVAIAIGYLTATKYMADHKSDIEYMENKTFVKYADGLWIHEYSDVQPIVPFDWNGKLLWSTLDEETKSKIILL